MGRSVAAVLLAFSLASLLLAAAAVADDSNADAMIRLPSDSKGLGMPVARMPWKCCDRTVCALTYPPMCICNDRVKQCESACKDCEFDENYDLYYCRDRYQGMDKVPRCTKGATVAATGGGH